MSSRTSCGGVANRGRRERTGPAAARVRRLRRGGCYIRRYPGLLGQACLLRGCRWVARGLLAVTLIWVAEAVSFVTPGRRRRRPGRMLLPPKAWCQAFPVTVRSRDIGPETIPGGTRQHVRPTPAHWTDGNSCRFTKPLRPSERFGVRPRPEPD